MFYNKNEFNAMLARKGFTRDKLAKALGISTNRLYRRLVDGNFYVGQIHKMIEIFGKEEVVSVFFDKVRD